MEIKEIVESAMNVSFVDSYKTKDTNSKNGAFDPKKVLTYTPWARAVEEALKLDPKFTWGVMKPSIYIYGDPSNTNKITQIVDGYRNYFDDGNTCWVETWAELCGKTARMTLPVMDGKNQPIRIKEWDEKAKDGNIIHHQAVTSTDVNKAIMRCLVKTLAVGFGLGLSIYYGEELNDDQFENALEQYKELVAGCSTIAELTELYNSHEWLYMQKNDKAIKMVQRRRVEIEQNIKK